MPHSSLVLALGAIMVIHGAASATAPVCIDFDGSLPPEATLTRATPRYDATGTLISANTPRFVDGLIAPAAQLISNLYVSDQVLDTEVVNGTPYVAIINNLLNVRLAIGTPECSLDRVDIEAPASVRAKFGFQGQEWGAPRTVQIFPDGTILVHGYQTGATDRRSLTIRTTVASFTDPQGWSLVRVSPYNPPSGAYPASPAPMFTRLTYLPHLNVYVSTITDYTPNGLVSSLSPTRGRSLGFGSTDGGLTWTRIIDTDDPALGANLVEDAKHLHHLEPFEWFDTGSGQWKIGAVGCLGDSEGESGQIWVRSPNATFPPEGQNALMTVERTRKAGRRALTDIFPINNSQDASNPLRFIQGNDGELAGIIEARVQNGVEENICHFRPTVPHVLTSKIGYYELPIYPFIFQMDLLGNGSILATTTDGIATCNPNGIWQSDTTGTRWATVRLGDNWGFNQVMPVGANRFWTQAILGTGHPFTYECQLWQVGDATPRQPILLGAKAHHATTIPLFDSVAPPGSLTDVSGTVAPPVELPASTPIKRLNIQNATNGVQFATCTTPITGAVPGDYVHLVFWVRPTSNQAGAQSFEIDASFTPTGGGSPIPGTNLIVDHETNMWTPVVIADKVPEGGVSSITFKSLCVFANATPDKPIDFLITPPTVFLSPQIVCQHVSTAGESEDRLTVQLPPLGADWTIGILATEARTFAASLVSASGDTVFITPGVTNQFPPSPGYNSTFEFRSDIQGSVTLHGSTSGQDVFVPTQDLVFLRHASASSTIEMWTSRGMGDFESISAAGVNLTPSEVRFGAPDWSTVFEGSVHRVKVWTDRALSETEMRRERLTLPLACEDAPPIDVAEPIDVCPPLPPPPCQGDVNEDGSTNVLDFNIFALNFGAGPGATRSQGDLTGDGKVNVSDFNIIANNYQCVAPTR